MRSIGVVTVARSDYSIYRPLLRLIQADPEVELRLYVTGMHLAPEFGRTVECLLADGFKPFEQIEMLLASDSPEGIAKSMGLGVMGFAQAFGRSRPDVLVVLGDRFEMITAALAALPFNIPVAHLHGGEATFGLIDEALRHGLTKLSHLHFASTEAYARRIVQMGEDPSRVFCVGAPALDELAGFRPWTREALEADLDFRLSPDTLLVTYHPLTLDPARTAPQCEALLEALDRHGAPVLFTYPNADTLGRTLIQRIEGFLETHPRARAVRSLGTQRYFSLLEHVAAMVGNSSSGILEAPSFGLPVVNIGDRQAGRIRAANVVDVEGSVEAILEGLRKATDPAFKATLSARSNPYSRGQASVRILEELKRAELSPGFVFKPFRDLPEVHP